jgi:hypothetical protein
MRDCVLRDLGLWAVPRIKAYFKNVGARINWWRQIGRRRQSFFLDTSQVYVGPETNDRPLLRLTEAPGRTESRATRATRRTWKQQPVERPIDDPFDMSDVESDAADLGQPASSTTGTAAGVQRSARSSALAGAARAASLVVRESLYKVYRITWTEVDRENVACRAKTPTSPQKAQWVAKAVGTEPGTADAAAAAADDDDDLTRPADVQHDADDARSAQSSVQGKGKVQPRDVETNLS